MAKQSVPGMDWRGPARGCGRLERGVVGDGSVWRYDVRGLFGPVAIQGAGLQWSASPLSLSLVIPLKDRRLADLRWGRYVLLDRTGRSGANGYVRYWDACTAVPFLFNPSKKHYISYEDSKSAGMKAVRSSFPLPCFELAELEKPSG